MDVRMFLEHITQERFARGLGDDWNGNVWSVPCCVINIGARRPQDEVVLPARERGFVLRREEEGGIFWDPMTNAVYRVDDEAYNAMLELDRGLSEAEVARRLGVEYGAVRDLVRSLDEIRSRAQTRGKS